MATVFVIHDPADILFVTGTLLKPLPSLGYDRWVPAAEESEPTIESMSACQAFIVVVTEAARRSDTVRRLTTLALGAPQITIVVQVDSTEPNQVVDGLGAVPKIDPGDAIISAEVPLSTRILEGLPQLLPPVEPASEGDGERPGVRIEWNEEYFSGYLQDAMTRHDFSRGQALVLSLRRHLRHQRNSYPEKYARADLETLRRKRQFLLMERYGEIMVSSGTEDLEVRRQYAQALIELGRFDEALPVLRRNAEAAARGENEWFEAHGLLGRLHKQQYVNAPGKETGDQLRRAIHEYLTVYEDYDDQFWHGVNAASLLLRASRDGFDWARPDVARRIAGRVLERFEQDRTAKNVSVWDFASQVEALVALERFDEAERALHDYVTHPDMNAFEVGSTFRQFEEVLQVAKAPQGRNIYDQLRRAADRYRAGGATSSPHQRDDAEEPDFLPVLIRLADPGWRPSDDVVGLRLGARLGTVISATAKKAAISALLLDPLVSAIEESRAVDADYECARSVPFIGVAADYTDTTGAFTERGSAALIAFIDDGIDVLHEAFLDDAGKSRILGIWDQRDRSGQSPEGFDYGTYHAEADIDRYVQKRSVPVALTRNVDGHGTHVASIAAGRAVGRFAGGVAPEARLVVVITRLDEDIGYSKAHLDALVFIDKVATERRLPVVVNVSKGTHAGAHDGKTALEVAFDEFSAGGRKAGRVVVKSAGNEREKRGHAEVFLRSGGVQHLRWTRDSRAKTRYERLELWWDASDEFEFKLTSPAGVASDWVASKSPDIRGALPGGGVYQMQLTRLHVDNGDNQLRVEIGDKGKGVAPGTWMLEIVAKTATSGNAVHAWIERGGRYSSAFDNCYTGDITLTVPGTAESVITVGAVEAATPTALGDFSSFGPTRDKRRKPDIAAPGVNIKAAQGGTDREVRVDHGTSMAAPHVAGVVALALSRAARSNRRMLAANQIRAALTRKARGYNGHHDPGQGYGIVDVPAFLAAF